MKKTVPVIVGALLVAGVVTVVVLDRAGWPGLAPRLAERSGFGLTVDPDTRVHLLWSPRLESAQLRVVGTGGEALADARDVKLAWHWRDIWDWRHGAPLRIRLVQAGSLAVNWQRDAQGRTPWPLQRDGVKHEPTPLPQIDHLILHNGTAHLDDAPLQLLADGRFDTDKEGRWKAEVKGKLRGQQLALNAEASGGMALLSSEQAGVPPVQLRLALTQGPQRLAFDGTAASLLDARALDGKLEV
ncbi:MAG: hypothetical protein EOP35_09530, partial [Rubrivivax sp.]